MVALLHPMNRFTYIEATIRAGEMGASTFPLARPDVLTHNCRRTCLDKHVDDIDADQSNHYASLLHPV
jgi:hypothetical protein